MFTKDTTDFKSYKLYIIWYSVAVFAVLLTDILLDKFTNISFSLINKSQDISSTFLPLMVTILSILFAILFVIIQLFKNRYPLNFIDNFVKNNFKLNFAIFTSNILFGMFLLVLNNDMLFSKIAYTLHTVFCIIVFINSFNIYKLFNPEKILNNYKERIIEKIDCNNLDKNYIIKVSKELHKYSEDSLAKNELSISYYIIDIYKSIILHFFANKDKLILNTANNREKDIADIEHNLFLLITIQMKYCVNYNYSNLLDEIQNELEDILINCIRCDKMNTFIKYTNIIDSFFIFCINREKFVFANNIVHVYGILANYLICKNDIRDEWIDLITEKFKQYCYTTNVHMSKNVLQMVYSEIFSFLGDCIKSNRRDLYDELFDDIIDLVNITLTKENYYIQNILKALIIEHTKKLLELNDINILENYITKMFDICDFAIETSNKDMCLHINSTYNYILKKTDDNNIIKIIEDKKYELTLKSITIYEDLVIYFIPNYINILMNNKNNTTKIEEVLNKFSYIIKRMLLRKSINILIFLIEELEKMCLIFNIRDKHQQEYILDVYEQCLLMSIDVKSSEKFHIILDKLNDLIKELDKNNLISNSLGNYILQIYKEIGKSSIYEKQIEFCITIIGSMQNFTKDINIFQLKSELFHSLLNNLFTLGVNAVENNMDDIIRNVSNSLGWIGLENANNKRFEYYKEVLNKSVNLINVCIDFNINDKTIIFIGTLFVVIGGCVLSSNNLPYFSILLNKIKQIKDKKYLIKSAQLRKYESNAWNEYMDNNAKHYMQEFIRKLNA